MCRQRAQIDPHSTAGRWKSITIHGKIAAIFGGRRQASGVPGRNGPAATSRSGLLAPCTCSDTFPCRTRPAKSPMQNSPRIILLLEATRGFDRGILAGIACYSALKGPWTFYRQPHGYLRSKRRLDWKELKAWKPDGAVCPVTQLEGLSKSARAADCVRRERVLRACSLYSLRRLRSGTI